MAIYDDSVILHISDICDYKVQITWKCVLFYGCQLEYVSCLSSQSIIYRCSFSYYSETYILTKSNCTATTTLHCQKLWKECEYSTSCIIAFIVWLLLQSWTKMLRKMHILCLILEHFPLKPGLLKILPPPPQKKQSWSVAGTFLLLTKQHWPVRGGGRGHHSAKFAGWVSCE